MDPPSLGMALRRTRKGDEETMDDEFVPNVDEIEEDEDDILVASNNDSSDLEDSSLEEEDEEDIKYIERQWCLQSYVPSASSEEED
jgi:hypothetical protein